MKLIRLIASDLHLGTGVEKGRLNPHEDFYEDERFAELLAHYDAEHGPDTEIELILNGDIFDLLQVQLDGVWHVEITAEIATEKLRRSLEGHPRFVRALRTFLEKERRRLVYVPGNHDLDMWFEQPQELFKRYVAPGDRASRVRFVTASDTYYLPEGVQIRHGHQFERIHWVDYQRMTRTRRDGQEVLRLPYGSLWILEVLNAAKEERNAVDRIQPLKLYLLGSLFFDPRFGFKFLFRSLAHFLRHRIFTLKAWGERLRSVPRILREEVFSIGGYDQAALRHLQRQRGVHTLVVGHSHAPRYRRVGNDKLLVNTGTWMKMINLNLQYLGQDSGLTYALIEYDDAGAPLIRLMRWHGTRTLSETIPAAY